MKRKLLSLLLSLIMVLAWLPMNVAQAKTVVDDNRAVTIPTISVVGTFAKPGSTVNVDLKIAENPGIAGARITLTYDAGLTLTDAVSGSAFEMLDFTRPGSYASPCNFSWDSESAVATDDGTILTLTFTVAEDASADDNLAINISYQHGDIYDTDLNDITVSMVGSYIDVIDFIYGDVNDDGTVNGKDVTLIRRYIAGGYDISINEQAADVNCDGTINGKDVTLIRRYIAGGYDVELPVVPPTVCNHNLEHVEAAPATCTEDGNNEYWHCTICGKYFSDANGSHEVSWDSLVIAATGHSYSTEWSYDSTYHWHAATCEHESEISGRAEHTFNSDNVCTVCGYSGSVVPGKPYHIEFRIYEYNTNLGDDYIGTQAIDNSANEEHLWFSSTETFELKSISCPGYTFLGWYTPDGDRMTSVPVGTNHDLILYARWSEIVYDITYSVYLTPVHPINEERYLHYTVSKGLQDLPNPELYNYEFLGWYNQNNEEVKKITVGTTGNMTLTAYFTSNRNLAKAAPGNDPTIITDATHGYIYFCYPLGTIENVPLAEFWRIQGVYGLSQMISVTESKAVTQSQADYISNTITQTTVDSGTWRLSEDWNETVHVDEGWAQEHGMTVEEAETVLQGTSNTYSTTTSTGGSSATTNTNGTTTVDYNSGTYDHGNGAKLYAEVNGKYTNTTEIEAHADVKTPLNPVGEASVGGSVSNTSTFEIGGKVGGEYTQDQNWSEHTGTDTTTVSTSVSANTSTWNNSATASSTQTASQSKLSSQVIADVLSSTYNIGRSYIQGTTQSTEQGFSNSDSASTNTSTTFTFSTTDTVTTTKTYSTDGKIDGWYRCVLAGKLHVFGVVGYDVATNSFFQYTYSIMDDNTYEFLDYSPYSSFDDQENCALPFEIPYDIFEYVEQMTLETEGLMFRTNTSEGTATVVGYTGEDEDVLIPTYFSNGGNSYVVTGLSASAFAGKNIKSIVLSDFIDEIAAGAFKNCTALEEVWGSFTKIGDEAFSGCTSLKDFNVSSSVVSVGDDAFLNVPSIKVSALNQTKALKYARELNPDVTSESQLANLARQYTQNVVAEILQSGANEICLDISKTIDGVVFTMDVPEIESFELIGGNRTYTDLKINSEADATIIRSTKIVDCTRIPLVISSDNVLLDTVTVNAQSFALLAKSQHVTIDLVRDNILTSASGHAIVCKDPTLVSQISTRAATIGVLDVSGNVYVCGNPPIPGVDYLDVTNGEIIYITDDQFNSLIRGCFTVTFDPNGGSVSTTSKDVEFGAKYGTLPTPTRATYDFMGWYTDPEGGTLVTADTVSTVIYDQTLYAHWELKQYTVTFNANGGSVSPTTMAAVIGTAPSSLPTPTRTGHTFAGWYTAASGGTQVTVSNWNTVIGGMDATTLVTNGLTLYAHWTVNSFTVTWSNGTGYTINVKRTSSPYAGASTGNLSSGATVYYGDVLTVTYTPATGYSIATHGFTSITVTGNVNSSTIYATASANSYTYNIVYRSVNGTNLGSTTITKTWGTTVTVSAPDKSSQGYTTPGSQTVIWDSTSPKTITFTYGIASVGYTTKSGTMDTSPKLTYSATLQYQNRTATTVQVRVVWTATIGAGSWTVYGQQLNASTNAGSSSVQVVAFNAWANSSSSNRSSTGTTGWMTVNLSTTNATTASVNVYLYQFNSNGTDMTNGYGTACVNTTWTMSIPAY